MSRPDRIDLSSRDPRLAPPSSDREALDIIAATLSHETWDADALDTIAEAVRSTGRVLLDVADEAEASKPRRETVTHRLPELQSRVMAANAAIVAWKEYREGVEAPCDYDEADARDLIADVLHLIDEEHPLGRVMYGPEDSARVALDHWRAERIDAMLEAQRPAPVVVAELPTGRCIGYDLTGEPVFEKLERGDVSRPGAGVKGPKESQVQLFGEHGGLFESQADARDSGERGA